MRFLPDVARRLGYSRAHGIRGSCNSIRRNGAGAFACSGAVAHLGAFHPAPSHGLSSRKTLYELKSMGD